MTDASESGGTAPNGQPTPERDAEEVRRHEAHLVGQIYYLIDANQKLEEQLHRLSRVTEIAEIFRQKDVSPDTFEMPAPSIVDSPDVVSAWRAVEEAMAELPADTPGLKRLREALGLVRSSRPRVDADWIADVRVRLLAAEQAIAFLDEQTRELDLLREEKNNIMDGVGRLEQTNEDLWKSLNEKTTHIQRLEAQLNRIWNSAPYRVMSAVRRPFRKEDRT